MQKILAVHGQSIITSKSCYSLVILLSVAVRQWRLKCVFPGLIQACAGALPSFMVLDVAEVLWEFLTFCREVTIFNFVFVFVLKVTSQHPAPVFNELFWHGRFALYSFCGYQSLTVSMKASQRYNLYLYSCNVQETSKWVQVSLQSIQTQSVPGSVIATPQQLQEFHNALIGWVAFCCGLGEEQFSIGCRKGKPKVFI